MSPRATLGESSIIARSGHPSSWDGFADHKGQLYVNTLDGKFYKALTAGRDPEWELTNLSSDGSVQIIEDPANPGFGLIVDS